MPRPRPPLLFTWLLLFPAALPSWSAEGATMAKAAATKNMAQAQPPAARFFIDEGYFLEGDTDILRAYIAASEGRMSISGESSAAFLSVKGYYTPDSWDVYWTIRQACHLAFKHMQHHQKVNCIPGVSAVSLKRTFVSTWQQAYGELAFSYIPRSYLIPEQYWLWRNYLLASQSPEHRKWVLKANIHRGKGVSVMAQHDAISHALAHKREHLSSSSSDAESDSVQYLNVLVQSYLQQQLVIAGRSSYIRVWLLITSINPLRAYLYDGGFAIFGKQKASESEAGAGAAANQSAKDRSTAAAAGKAANAANDDLIVNLWMQDRNSSSIWSVHKLRAYLDAHPEVVQPLPSEQRPATQPQQALQAPCRPAVRPGRHFLQSGPQSFNISQSGCDHRSSSQDVNQHKRTFADAWNDMQVLASLVLAAALPAMRAAALETSAPQQGTFEYFGLDFVLDAHLQPWMLEVNAIPSMARRSKSDCAGETATSNCQLGSRVATGVASTAAGANGSSSKGSESTIDDFDAQKEQFVHDMLVLLGLPVDSSTQSAAAGASEAQGSTLAAAELLRMAAAAAAAAGIRSAAHPLHRGPTKMSSAMHDSLSSNDRHLLAPQHKQHGQKRLHVRHVTPHEAVNHSAVSSHDSSHGHSSRRHVDSSSSSDSSAASEEQPRAEGFRGVPSLHWTGSAPPLTGLPAEMQRLLCRADASSAIAQNEFACISCLTADHLSALAAAESELQRAGRFVPIYNLLPAHNTNLAALQQAAGHPAAGSTATAVATNSNAAAAATAAAAAGTPAGGSKGSLYLAENPSVWQRLYRAWKRLSGGHAGDLAVMRFYTNTSSVSAETRLQLTDVDYAMSAWLRVRTEEKCVGSTAVDCVVKRMTLLVNKCYL